MAVFGYNLLQPPIDKLLGVTGTTILSILFIPD